jgi:penicillin-binding protein 1C
MDRNQIRKIAFILTGLATAGLFNRLELLNPLEGVSFSREVYDRNGKLLRLTLSGDEQYRAYRPLKQIDEKLKKAVILSEDRYFHYHWGINPISFNDYDANGAFARQNLHKKFCRKNLANDSRHRS